MYKPKGKEIKHEGKENNTISACYYNKENGKFEKLKRHKMLIVGIQKTHLIRISAIAVVFLKLEISVCSKLGILLLMHSGK